jgi:hypothetical protein
MYMFVTYTFDWVGFIEVGPRQCCARNGSLWERGGSQVGPELVCRNANKTKKGPQLGLARIVNLYNSVYRRFTITSDIYQLFVRNEKFS